MNDSSQLKTFFDKEASNFDSYYIKEDKPLIRKFLDFVFRGSIQRRLQLTLKECESFHHLRILDIGCGSGRSSVELAKQNGNLVTGVDFSSEMLKLAQALAQKNQMADRCQFILGDFLTTDFGEKFDMCVALGFFDYVKHPADYLGKMKKLTTATIVASFPAQWRLRNIVRIVRLKILGCPVYFYTEDILKKLCDDISIKNYVIKNIGRDYLVMINLSSTIS